jgi:hypothetical protein
MNMPMQHRPVERQIPSSTFSAGKDSALRAIAPSGIEPSGIFDDIMSGIKAAAPIVSSLAPVLGSLI